MSTLISFEPFLETCNSKISTYMLYSNMTSFFRFVSKRAIYWLGIISLAHAPVHVTDFPVVNVHVDELSSARILQHKLCATFSANVKKYKLPSSNQSICTLRHIRIERRGITFPNIHQPMLNLKTHSCYHDLFLNSIFKTYIPIALADSTTF